MVGWRRSRALAALLVGLLAMLSMVGIAGAQPVDDCNVPESGEPICGEFLAYWESNGGLPVFGYALTESFVELSSDTLLDYEVQYYERERFELHPENVGTPYVILLGRLGVDVLTANGIDWMTLPQANPSDAHYMDATGQAIAQEFWGYWSSHGLDFGDEGVSFRESLALFGYPVTPAEIETNADGDTVLTQWYERARFELHADDTVLLGRLGAEVNDADGQFAIRVQLEMDAVLRKAFGEYESHGTMVGVWSSDHGEWVGNLGVANPDTEAPYTGETHHRIGSLTKTFTATLILQLVDQGMLSLDDTVDQWFDGVTYGDRITIRQMLDMTSGIASYTLDSNWVAEYFADPTRIWQPQELVDAAISLPPSFEPGTGWEYSNSNYVMLGLIVEAVTGADIRVALHELILDPLGLAQTSFPAQDDATIPAPYARGDTQQGQPAGVTADATHWSPTFAWTAGQLISTIDDMRIWARALAGGELLTPETQAERLTWVTLPPNSAEKAYGLGIVYEQGWLGHEGELPGYNTGVYHRPDLDASLIIFTNSDIPNADGVSPAAAVYLPIIEILNREYPLPPTE
jgi:D-alanyl-D-alanine carboxypeptidase